MADGCHVVKYSKYYNSPTNELIGTKVGWLVASHYVPDMSAKMELPWQRPLPSKIRETCLSVTFVKDNICVSYYTMR